MGEKFSLPNYGGQAVIEGVMMRGKNAVAIAMRAPDKKIVIHTEKLGKVYRSKLIRLPFLRGLIMLWDALGLGVRALMISANVQGQEEEQKLEGPALYATVGFSLVLGIGLFMLIPAAIGQLSERFLLWNSWWGNLFEGIIRLAVLIGYIAVIGRIPEIRRVFAYHGAEHKTINAYEAGVELTPENVAKFSLQHPRCGTAFLLTLVLLSVLLFAMLGPLPMGWRLVSRVLALPLLAGVAYEYIRLTARNLNSSLVRVLIAPNLALQKLTTREPSLDMLEVSIAAFKEVRLHEEQLNL